MRRRTVPALPAILTALVLASLPLAAGCSPDGETGGAGTEAETTGAGNDAGGAAGPADPAARRQRDSVIGESRLPGARGVRGALDASDAAAARNAALDSLQP